MKRRVAVGIGLAVFLAGAVAQHFLHFVEQVGRGFAAAGAALNGTRPGGLSLSLWLALALALVLGSVWVRGRRRVLREQPYARLASVYAGARRYRQTAWNTTHEGAELEPDAPDEETGVETYRRQTLKSRASGARGRKKYTVAEGAKGGSEGTPVTSGD
ncbi:MAG: hypothetical protein AB1776_02730 [Bacillota bacterium]